MGQNYDQAHNDAFCPTNSSKSTHGQKLTQEPQLYNFYFCIVNSKIDTIESITQFYPAFNDNKNKTYNNCIISV